jgi:hypothetical protein
MIRHGLIGIGPTRNAFFNFKTFCQLDHPVQNFQCQYICRRPDHKIAIETLKQYFAVAWNTTRTADAWHHLQALLGIAPETPSNLPSDNVAPVARDEEELLRGWVPPEPLRFLTASLRSFIADRNREDMLLLEWIERKHNNLFIQTP